MELPCFCFLAQNMKFDLIEKEDTMFGQPFDVTLKVTNANTEPRDVKATLTATVVYYTGVAVKVIKSNSYNIKAPGNSGNLSSLLILTTTICHVTDLSLSPSLSLLLYIYL